MSAVIRVELRQNKSHWPLKRAQRWSWRAVNVGNNEVMARSSESYTNAEDCRDAAAILFGDGARVWLREPGYDDAILREMTE